MIKKVLPVYIILLCILGCATGSIRETSTPAIKLSNYKSISIIVSAAIPEWSWEVYYLKKTLVKKFNESGMFNKIIEDTNGADLQLKVLIVDVKRVSRADRIWVGAMAGRAGIDAEVKLYDTLSNNCIASFDAYGRSSGGSVIAGTTIQAIDQTANQICHFLQR